MIQCKDCEYFEEGPGGQKIFHCEPFRNIKEPECLAKWQLMRLDMLLAEYQGMRRMYQKFAPLQDKMLRYMQREIDEMEDAEGWKFGQEEDDEEENGDEEPRL